MNETIRFTSFRALLEATNLVRLFSSQVNDDTAKVDELIIIMLLGCAIWKPCLLPVIAGTPPVRMPRTFYGSNPE